MSGERGRDLEASFRMRRPGQRLRAESEAPSSRGTPLHIENAREFNYRVFCIDELKIHPKIDH